MTGDLGTYLNKMAARADQMQPKLVTADANYRNREAVRDVLPEGATLSPVQKRAQSVQNWTGSAFMNTGSGSSQFHTQRPYLPEFDSPDRQWYPVDRLEANYYWRMFYKTDPVFGTAVDMYANMMVSDFDIELENESDQTIKQQLEDMCEQTKFLENFQYMVKEFLVTGEAVPHCLFDETEGVWSYLAFHNPDFIEIQDSPILDMEPIINFLPDDCLRELLTASTPESLEIRKRLPAEFVSKVLARQKIRMSPLNCSYIPRKLHPYDERGTSIASRLWRIWMVEDAVYNSTLATFRRAASPLKIIKMGDPNTGWIPEPEKQNDMLRMLAQAEMDPQSWLVTHFGTNYEAWGNTDRAVTLSREHDTIEKVKLLALGLSKSFMSGEVTYSSQKSGLQVFLRRLLSMRQFFENSWILPKFFGPIVAINDWTKSTPAEVNHRIRVKRTAQESAERGLLITPKLKWRNKLDPTVDSDTLQAYGQLKNFGFDISNSTIGSVVSLDWEDETRKKAKEFKSRDQILTDTLGESLKQKYEQQAGAAAKPPGTAGGGAKPPGAAGAPKQAPGGKPTSNPPGSGDEAGGSFDDGLESPSTGMPETIQ
jgi:hypothetical protein